MAGLAQLGRGRDTDRARCAMSRMGSGSSSRSFRSDRFDDDTDRVFSGFVGNYRICRVQTGARRTSTGGFVQHPRYRYEKFLARDGSRPVGYIVMKQFHPPDGGLSVGDLVNVLWNGEARP